MSIRHAFDSLCLRDSRLFGWGWLLHDVAPATRIDLVLCTADGDEHVVRCQQAGSRDDLAEAYPGIAHARGGGFLLQGRLRSDLRGCNASLRVVFSDGSARQLLLPDFPDRYLTQDVAGQLHNRWGLVRDLVAQGRWLLLLRRIGAAASRRLSLRLASARQAKLPCAGDSPVLMIDHAMGGGANHFRDEQVAALRAQGRSVLLLLPHLPSLNYDLVALSPQGERQQRFVDLAACLAALPMCHEIIVNSLVSFDDPCLIVEWLLAQPAGAHLTFYLHDYHPVCPVWTLVDERGTYCGIPGRERCQGCLASNEAPFLAMMPVLDIGDWRRHWQRLLLRTDRLVAFSNASVAILRKAYPELPAQRISVVPHDTSYIKPDPVAFDLALPLTIGVVGAINVYKGAQVVAEMARIIERDCLPARIVVIGSIDNVLPSPALRVTGAYCSEQLAQILRNEGVGLCLLPSIWHETFSYVTAEIMAHGMPLAAFDLGAPAERVRNYAMGRIIPEMSARAALKTLFELRDALLANATAGAPLPTGLK
jgi:glycosyltransferase involved in cell wall biosynthesis